MIRATRIIETTINKINQYNNFPVKATNVNPKASDMSYETNVQLLNLEQELSNVCNFSWLDLNLSICRCDNDNTA